MSQGCMFSVGDLVEYKSWYDGHNGWVSIDGLIGIVLEIIEISSTSNPDLAVSNIPEEDPIYDIRVYWYTDGASEIVPDLLLVHYCYDLRGVE